jgi:hypothetical protein
VSTLHDVPDRGRPTRILPGRPGRLPAQGSHGSGRAQLRHPARPANHSHAPVARCDPPLTTASAAIRRPCVDRGSGLDVPALFPDDGRLTRKPPSLRRLRAGWPVRRLQRYYEALRLLPAHRSKLIVFAEDLPPCASDAFAPFAAHWQPQGPGTLKSADPNSRMKRREQTGLPGSWGTPRCPRRLLRPRRDRPPRPLRESKRGPRLRARQGLPRRDQFRG